MAEQFIVASKREGAIEFLRPNGRPGDDSVFEQYFNKDDEAVDRIREWASSTIDAACAEVVAEYEKRLKASDGAWHEVFLTAERKAIAKISELKITYESIVQSLRQEYEAFARKGGAR